MTDAKERGCDIHDDPEHIHCDRCGEPIWRDDPHECPPAFRMTDATERAREILVGLTDGPDCKHHEGLSVFCALCARTDIAAALTAEREAGRREGLEEAAHLVETRGVYSRANAGAAIRALVGAGGTKTEEK